ncbi:reducing type I polyketide synthase 10, partial [Metarhizium brunneum ARSEF 3297]
MSSSETLWDFKLTIYREGVPVLHATGTIAIHESAAAEAIEPRIRLSEAELESSAKQIWYQRFGKGGLNYGPLFQSVNEIWVLRSSADKVVLGMVRLEQKSAVDGSAPARYLFHPITLEVMVQAGILATESRLQTYTASTNQGARGLARYPTLRVVWKPDVQGPELLREADLTKYLNHFLAEAHSPVGKDDGLIKLGAAISLISHRNTRLSIILELAAVLALVP